MSVDAIDPGWPVAAIDLHQHLWPEQLVDRLRARSRTPYLRGWTLFTQGEAPYEIEPAHHDVGLRLRENARDGIGLACLSLSAPLGIESLRGPSAAGLAPVHHERHVARGGTSGPVDPLVHVDTSSYGLQGLDALVRVLGIDALVLGSDRPYAAPIAELMGDAATRAVRVTNPRRALGLPVTEVQGVRSWPRAS